MSHTRWISFKKTRTAISRAHTSAKARQSPLSHSLIDTSHQNVKKKKKKALSRNVKTGQTHINAHNWTRLDQVWERGLTCWNCCIFHEWQHFIYFLSHLIHSLTWNATIPQQPATKHGKKNEPTGVLYKCRSKQHLWKLNIHAHLQRFSTSICHLPFILFSILNPTAIRRLENGWGGNNMWCHDWSFFFSPRERKKNTQLKPRDSVLIHAFLDSYVCMR